MILVDGDEPSIDPTATHLLGSGNALDIKRPNWVI
jgi:hypothetical protein